MKAEPSMSSTKETTESDVLDTPTLVELNGQLSLCSSIDAHGPIFCDFVAGAGAHRRKFGGGLGQPLARACGISGKFKPRLCDATAGMGGDSLVFASLGAQVTMVERQPSVAALLRDGLTRLQAAAAEQELAGLSERLELVEADGAEYLAAAAEAQFDVVYLDPMFPPRDKSAKVKKAMAAFHRLVGGDSDADQLLSAARRAAVYRVVVKRPRGAEPVGGQAPSHTIEGKTVRYDIYVNRAIPKG